MDGGAVVAERMLTTDEVAAMFRVGRAQVNRWARKYPRQLGAVKLTPRGQWRWPESKAIAVLSTGLVDEDEDEEERAA